jgi:hypothetical protein
LPTKVLNTVLPDEELTVGQSDKQVVGIMTGKTWTRDILWLHGDTNWFFSPSGIIINMYHLGLTQ